MKRISTATRVLNKFGAGKDGFTDGDVLAGVPATDLEAALFDHLQEEVAGVIEAAGIVLSDLSRAQLLAAIRSPALIAGRLVNVQLFAASGTYTPFASNLSKIIVEAVGGGGAGGGSVATSSSSSAGGGGGGGCYAKVQITSIPASVAVTIGAGGAGSAGAAGGNGGTTSFGSIISVGGGIGGSSSAASTTYPVQALPGAGSGTFSISGGVGLSIGYGGPGNWGLVFSLAGSAQGGGGGTSTFGGGANYSVSSSGGTSAGTRGAGGGGTCNSTTGSATAGGAGGVGVVIVYEYQ